MPDLSQAQVIGGAVVTIGADPSGLRSGEAQAKATTATIDRMKGTVQVTAEATGLTQVVAKAQEAVSRVGSMQGVARIATELEAGAEAKVVAGVRSVMAGAVAAARSTSVVIPIGIDYKLPEKLDPKWLMNAVAKTGSLKSEDLESAVRKGVLPPPPELEAAASAVRNTRAAMPVSLDLTAARAQLQEFKQELQSSSATMRANTDWAYPNGSPQQFTQAAAQARYDYRPPVQPQLEGSVGPGPGAGWAWGGASAYREVDPDVQEAQYEPVPQRLLPAPPPAAAPFRATSGYGSGEGAFDPEPAGAAGGGDGLGAAVGEAAAGGGFKGFGSPRGLFHKVALPLIGIDAIASEFGAIDAFRKLGKEADNGNDPDKMNAIIEQGRKSIADIPIAGGVINKVGYAGYGTLSGIKNLVTTGTLQTDYGAAEEIRADAAQQDTKTAKGTRKLEADKQFREVTKTNDNAIADSKLDAQDRDVAQVLEQRNKLIDRINAAGVAGGPSAKEAIASADRLVAAAKNRAQAADVYDEAVSTSNITSIQARGSDATLRSEGRTDDAGRAAVKEATRSQVDPMQAQLDQLKATDTDRPEQVRLAATIKALKDAGDKSLAAYDKELETQRAEVVAQANSGTKQYQLKGAGRVDDAAREGIRQAYQPGIDAATKNNDKATAEALGKERDAQLQAFNDQLKTDKGNVITGTNAEAQQTRLRGQGRVEEADESSIKEAFRPRIEAARKNGDTDVVNSLTDDQDAQIAERRRQQAVSSGQAIAAADAEAEAARLRIAGQGNRAELVLFDEAAKARIETLRQSGATEAQINAEQKKNVALRGETTQRQAAFDARASRELETRRDVAGAQGNRESNFAGIIQTLATQKNERDAAEAKSPKYRVEVAQTEAAELMSARKQLVAGPNRYAEEVDLRHMVPIGNSGKDDSETLKAIDKGIADLLIYIQKNGGKGLSN